MKTTGDILSMRAWLQEMKELEDDYLAVTIPLFVDQIGSIATLGDNGTLRSLDMARYSVPITHKLAVTRISGYVAMNWQLGSSGGQVYGDAAALGNASALTKRVQGMIRGRAMSAEIQLKHTRDGYGVVEGRRKLNLSTILFNSPLEWKRPHIVPRGETLELIVNILDTTFNGTSGSTGPVLPGDASATPGRTTDSFTPSGAAEVGMALNEFVQWGVIIQGALIRELP
jgi:hypothetical protein